MSKLILLQKFLPEDSLELIKLKGTFNSFATQMNLLWDTLSIEEKQELYSKLKGVEEQIYQYQ